MMDLPPAHLDPDELAAASQTREQPAVEPEDVSAVRQVIAALRGRVASEGLHRAGRENKETWLWLLLAEEELERIRRDVIRERSTQN